MTNNGVKITGGMIKDILEMHYGKKLKITAIELNNDIEVLKREDNLTIFLEEMEDNKTKQMIGGLK